jgi:hypothetical protein
VAHAVLFRAYDFHTRPAAVLEAMRAAAVGPEPAR